MNKNSKQDNSISTAFQDVWRNFVGTLKSADRLVPCIVPLTLWLAWTLICGSALFVNILPSLILFIVVVTSLISYVSRNNYGEAALALSAGLLAVFTVNWNLGNSIAFFMAWVIFSLSALVISSINLSAKYQSIYLDAASAMESKYIKKTAKELEEIANQRKTKYLGPIPCAEVIRIFAFRKLTVRSMKHGVDAVETLSIIAKADHKLIATFIADLYRIFEPDQEKRYVKLVDEIYTTMHKSPVSPAEFIEAFYDSRRVALSGKFTPEIYFQKLVEALEQGASPKEVYEYLMDNL